MDQYKRLIGTLSVRQRWTIVIATVLVAAALFGIERWQRENNFRPLYTALAAEDAAAVVQKLKEENVPYRLSADGAAISVPQERVPELRLEMASAGLPKSGRIGFEIFDKTNLGMTDFAEHINFQRALEGELERSVMSISQVDQARVHISFPQESVFTEARKPAKASVLVRLHTGAHLPDTAVPAITHLIASAVEGLAPESVSVLDMRGTLLNKPKRASDHDQELSEAALEYQRMVEQSLVAKLDSTLEPLVGAGRFRTSVSADCDPTSGEQNEENFDPTHSVMVTSQKTEDITSPRVTAGVPGTASNLPDGAPRPATTVGGVSRTTESVSYQSSRTVKKTVIPQGAIRRLSVSVLLDNDVRFEGKGNAAKRILTPPSPERLKVIHELAAAAIGFDMERGDQLIVDSLPFESSLNMEPNELAPGTPGGPAAPKTGILGLIEAFQNSKYKTLIGAAVAIILALLMGAGFMLSKRNKANAKVKHIDSLPSGLNENRALPDEWQPSIASNSDAPTSQALVASAETPEKLLAAQVREVALKDADLSVGVLRGWLREGQS